MKLLLCTIILFGIAIALPSKEKIQEFEAWYKSRNPSYEQSKLKLGNGDDYSENRLGLYTTQSIDEDEILFSIPSDLIITVDFVESRSEISETLGRYYERYADHSEYDPARYDALALWLLYHAVVLDNSPWLPWLEMFPTVDEMNMVLFWHNREIKELEGSPLYNRALDRRKRSTEKYEWLVEEVFRTFPRVWSKEPSEIEWKWATSIVRSTNFQLRDSLVNVPALVPMADMMRHEILSSIDVDQDKETVHYDSTIAGDAVEIKAFRDFAAGEEVKFLWFSKCNAELLDYWGFVPESNPNDCVHVDTYLELPDSDPLLTQKSMLYRMLRPENSKMKVLRNGITSELQHVLRVLGITEYDLTDDMLLNGVPNEPLGIMNDYKVSALLTDICRKAYKLYPTSIEEDVEILENPLLSERVKMAVQLRKGEKEILWTIGKHYFYETQQIVEELNELQREMEQANSHEEL